MNILINLQQQLNQFILNQQQWNNSIIDIVQELIDDISNEIE
jgi:hypothetical protein